MLHIVVYDISDSKRLRHAARLCERFGVRVEKSVFEANLEDDEFRGFWKLLNREIEPGEDSLIAYRICRSCAKDVLTAGIAIRPEGEPECLVV